MKSSPAPIGLVVPLISDQVFSPCHRLRQRRNAHRRTNSQFSTPEPGDGADRCADVPSIAAGLLRLLKASAVRTGRRGAHDTKVK